MRPDSETARSAGDGQARGGTSALLRLAAEALACPAAVLLRQTSDDCPTIIAQHGLQAMACPPGANELAELVAATRCVGGVLHPEGSDARRHGFRFVASVDSANAGYTLAALDWSPHRPGEDDCAAGLLAAAACALDEMRAGQAALFAVWADIGERRRRQRTVERLVHFDDLTGLPNRRFLKASAEEAIRTARADGSSWALLWLDLDGFKNVNDSAGHALGDVLLQRVAARLRGQVCSMTPIFARLGGDEFAVLIRGAGRATLNALCVRLCRDLARPYRLRGTTMRVGASVGVVTYPQDGDDLETLLKNADIAMYRAKLQGSTHRFYDPADGRRVRQQVQVERELASGIANGELTLVYQPRRSLADGRISSVEALVRWRHPQRGLLAPAQFIGVAERSGLIHALGRSVLVMACRQQRHWRQQGLRLRVSVNITCEELQRTRFCEEVLQCLEAHGLDGAAMELEITETAVMSDAERNARTLAALKAAGMRIAVDDFGTGYSSLNYLKRLPVDTLKIDRSFVADMVNDRVDADIVKTVIALARSLKLGTAAEGVEIAAQQALLNEFGCDEVQGLLICPPVDAKRLERLLIRAQSGAVSPP